VADDAVRSRTARAAAESALVRVVHHYGTRPEFVVVGGLVPELLCSSGDLIHAGTIDVDVQIDLEVACGSVNVVRLERALRNAEFEPEEERVWRWSVGAGESSTVVRFELLADQEDAPADAIVRFDECERLGAVNLRGSGFAARDFSVRELTARVGDDVRGAEVNVAGLAGFLLAKNAAARARRSRKDWYDLAFVLLHNDEGGPEAAARAVLSKFGGELRGAPSTALRELAANFADHHAQGTRAYVEQVLVDHPGLDAATLGADAVVAVSTFCGRLIA